MPVCCGRRPGCGRWICCLARWRAHGRERRRKRQCALYAELKAQKTRPWPTRQFIAVLNEAVNQGILVRAVSGPEFGSLAADGTRELLVPKQAPPTPKPQPASSSRESSEVTMALSDLQDFVEDTAPALTKLLAGASPEFAVRVRLKGKAAADLAAANEVLKKINPDWGF